MAHSNVHLVNTALIRLGQSPITSLTDQTSKRARLANQLFESVRDSVLSENQWNASVVRAELAELTTKPVFGFNRAFQLPSDFLRLIRVGDQFRTGSFPFRIEGRTLVSDEANVKITYVARLKDPTRMDEFLKHAITTRLSAELSLALTGSETKFRAMWALYGQAISEARFHDAVQSPIETLGGSEWLDARFRAGFGRTPGIEIGVVP